MDKAFGIIFVIIILLFALGPLLRRWFAPLLQRWMLGKMEDNMRRMAGMPTRKEERKARRKAARQRGTDEEFGPRYERSRNGRGAYPQPSAGGMMQHVAEDVEFTEIREYKDENTHIVEHTEVKYRVEEQVEDAEFEDLKQ